MKNITPGINLTIIDLIKNIAEILAIIIGGYWAYYTFILTDKPKLKESISISNKLETDYANDSTCQFNYNIEIKNIGITTFKIDSVHIYIWHIPSNFIIGKDFFDVEQYIFNNKRIAALHSIKTSVLCTSYPPETINNEDFSFFFLKSDSTAILFNDSVYGSSKGNIIVRGGTRWMLKSIP